MLAQTAEKGGGVIAEAQLLRTISMNGTDECDTFFTSCHLFLTFLNVSAFVTDILSVHCRLTRTLLQECVRNMWLEADKYDRKRRCLSSPSG